MPSKYVLNTRKDLDNLKEIDQAAYVEFVSHLGGSTKRMQDIAVYPADYNKPDYQGDKIKPVWKEVEDTSAIERFGFAKSDFN